MAITLSPDLDTARTEACRLPALQETLARLVGADPDYSAITLYDHADPDDGTASAIVTIAMTEAAGTIDTNTVELTFDTPIEALVDGADASNGSEPLSARITGPTGTWEMDMVVSPTGMGGDVQLAPTGTDGGGNDIVELFNGATARITVAVIQG